MNKYEWLIGLTKEDLAEWLSSVTSDRPNDIDDIKEWNEWLSEECDK